MSVNFCWSFRILKSSARAGHSTFEMILRFKPFSFCLNFKHYGRSIEEDSFMISRDSVISLVCLGAALNLKLSQNPNLQKCSRRDSRDASFKKAPSIMFEAIFDSLLETACQP